MAQALAANSAYSKVVLVFFSSASLVSSFLIDILVLGGRSGALLVSVLSLIAPLSFLHFYVYFHEKVTVFSHRVVSTLLAYFF
ncbi:MAG: hypothetical protein RIS75_218, partial [Actinomycetota bacterium]